MAVRSDKSAGLYHQMEEIIRPFIVGSISGTYPAGIPRVPVEPFEMEIDGHIRADTLPGGMGDEPRELRLRLLERSEELMDVLAGQDWLPCHGTMRQEFVTHFGSPSCTFGNEVVKPAPQHGIALKFSVSLRKFAGKAQAS